MKKYLFLLILIITVEYLLAQNTKTTNYSFATGQETKATGIASTATGYKTLASGNNSTAMGSNVSTNGKFGSFIIGDGTDGMGATGAQRVYVPVINNEADNQMLMRFAGGYKFHISGSFGFFINPDGNASLTGTLSQASDMRLKRNIHPLENSLTKIMQLNSYSFHWKDELADKNLQIGVMAQEVQKLFPEIVKEDSKGMLSVNYSGLIPVMIESIKELEQQIEELQKMVAALIKK